MQVAIAHCIAVACTRVVLNICLIVRKDVSEADRRTRYVEIVAGVQLRDGAQDITPRLVIELKACVKQCSVLIRVFDAFRFAAVTMHAIYECGQLFASIQLGGGLIFVA